MNYALFDEPNIRIVSRAVLTIAALPGAKTLRGSYTLSSLFNF